MSTATMNPPAANGAAVNDPWEMEVGKGGGNYVLCPAGNYPATIVGLFDVGHQPETDKDGKAFDSRKLILVFELAKKQPDGQPFFLGERYTWSMKDNSNFYAMASNLTGRKFKEGEKFNPTSLLGMPVMVQVTNNTVTRNNKDKTYHNIGSVAQFPEGLPAPAPTRQPTCWSALMGQALPDVSWVPFVYGSSIKDMVQTSTEYRAGKVPAIEPSAAASEEGEDSIPF